MIELIAGHKYKLNNLNSLTYSILQFYMDPELHDGEGYNGPSTQEVIRACIARVYALDNERNWPGNADIIHHLRCAIAGFEARAILRRAEKEDWPIESLPVNSRGHII